MTRVVDLHPFQPTWRDAVRQRLLPTVIGVLRAIDEENGLLACLGVIALAALLPLIPPDLFME